MNRRRVLRALLALSCVQLVMVAGSGVDGSAEHREHPTTVSGGSVGAGAGSAAENKFLKYLFNKYGSKGVISFEGLEHLMHSLGLGGLDFTPSHTLDEHRPEGFRTDDLLKDPFTTPEDDHEVDAKVTVAFNGIDDHGRPQYSTVQQGSTAAPEEGTLRNRREQQQGHEAIINGSDWIRELNEVVSPSTEKVQGGNKTEQQQADDEDKTLKWHNEIWQEIIFKDIHDPQHRHPRRDDHRKSCLSPMSMVHLVLEEPSNFEGMLRENFNFGQELRHHLQRRRRRSLPHAHHHNHQEGEEDGQDEEWDHEVEEIIAARIKITPATFKDLCPALLAQIDQRACHQKLRDQPMIEKKLFGHAWIYAVICVTIISICGLAGVAMVPLAKSVAYDEILRFLVALAVGTLCGDALMHLLPHALITHGDPEDPHQPSGDDHGHSHSDEPVWLCCCAFLSALFMYTLETVLPLLRSVEGHGGGHHGHAHGRAKVAPAPEPTPSDLHQVRRNTNVTDDIELDLQDSRKKELNTMLEKKQVEQQPLSPVAFMVILGDGLHNVTDGLAIGAAFAADPVTGMATSLAILCHELPHELGDFALLLQTGVSIKRAMFLNIVSSILSFAGMFIGLLVTGLHESVVRWIYAGTAGTFLYIALADLVPEMNRDLHDPAVEGQRCKKLRLIWSQIAGIFLGGMIMLVIALNEDHLRVLFE